MGAFFYLYISLDQDDRFLIVRGVYFRIELVLDDTGESVAACRMDHFVFSRVDPDVTDIHLPSGEKFMAIVANLSFEEEGVSGERFCKRLDLLSLRCCLQDGGAGELDTKIMEYELDER